MSLSEWSSNTATSRLCKKQSPGDDNSNNGEWGTGTSLYAWWRKVRFPPIADIAGHLHFALMNRNLMFLVLLSAMLLWAAPAAAKIADSARQEAATGSPSAPYEEESVAGASRIEGFRIVQLISEGWLNKQIAYHIGINLKTVESHRAAAMRKMEARTTAGVVRWALRNNLVQA